MVTIVTRAGKGSALTHAELDGNQTNLNNGKAELLTSPAITGNGTITAAAHANRTVRVTAAASCTVDNSNWNSDSGVDHVVFRQDGSGALTLTGSNVALAPGVASATTNGDGSSLHCYWRSSDSKLIAYLRTAAAAGGGSGFMQDQRVMTAVNAAGAIGVEETLAGATLNMTALSVGQLMTIRGLFSLGSWTGASMTQSFFRIYVNGAQVFQSNIQINARGFEFDLPIIVRATSGAGALITPALDYKAGEPIFNPSNSVTATVSGTFSIAATITRNTATDVSFTLEWLRATVE
jgi:hypothetical protein